MDGTDLVYGATLRYAMCGTDLVYGATGEHEEAVTYLKRALEASRGGGGGGGLGQEEEGKLRLLRGKSLMELRRCGLPPYKSTPKSSAICPGCVGTEPHGHADGTAIQGHVRGIETRGHADGTAIQGHVRRGGGGAAGRGERVGHVGGSACAGCFPIMFPIGIGGAVRRA
eukprot:2136603-Rhodomonas_salina.1